MDQNSVVDYIAKTGGDSSLQGRASLYEKNGLGSASDYLALGANNADANTALLTKLRGSAPSQLINTSTKSRTTFNQNSSDLSAALAKLSGAPTAENPNPDNGESKKTTAPTEADALSEDPIMKGLTTLQTNADAATKALIASTQALYQNQKNKVTSQYENYKRGLMGLGIQHNEAQSTPDLLAGHIQQATNDQMDKINTISAEESKALIDAQNAKAENDFKTLQAKMDYVKQLKADKANAIKDMYDSLANTDKTAALEAHDIYDTLQTLGDADKQAFIEAVAKKYNVPLMSLVTALNDEKNSRADASLKTQNAQATLNKKSGTGSGGTKVTIDDASNEIDTHLKPIADGGILGEDGFMSPYKWLELRDTWIKSKLSKTTFDTLYKRYLNPDSYTLAGFAKPKGTARTL